TPRLDRLERHSVHARRAVVLTGERVGENVGPMDLVVEQVEPVGGLSLRLAIELPLKAADLIRRCKAHRQSPSIPTFLGQLVRSQGPLLRRRYPASTLLR